MVSWGAAVERADGSSGFRLGYEWFHHWAADYSSVTIELRIWVGTKWPRSDASNTFSSWGAATETVSIPFAHNGSTVYSWHSTNQSHVKTYSWWYGLSPGQSATLAVGCSLTGIDTIPGTASISEGTTATRPAVVPSTPAAPTISNRASDGATVTMVLPNNGGAAITDTWFSIYTVASGGTAVTSDGIADTRTSHTFDSLSRATNYWAEVWAKNSVGWSAASPRTAFTTLPEPPTLAGTPAATNIARTSFVVPTATISDTGGQSPSQYRVQVNTSATDVGADLVTQTSWAPITVSSRLPLTQYYYRVAAYNPGGWGAYTAWATVTTLDAVPDDPAAPVMSTISETSAYVSWVAPALNGATLDNYLVRVCIGNDPNAYVKTQTLPPGVTGVSVSGLTKGTWYNVFVKALATPTDSGWSQPGTFKTAGSWSTLRPWFKSGGVWYRALVWKNDGGTWKRVYTGLNVAGTWRRELD